MAGWPSVPLGELCRITSGGTPSRSVRDNFGGTVPWVKIGDMLQGVVSNTEESITERGLSGSSAKLLPAGTVLISIFATVGRTAVLGIDAATNQAIAGITPYDQDKMSISYLRRYLDSVVSDLKRKSRGVAQLNINLSILKSLEIPVPPLQEQQRLVRILASSEALRVKRRSAMLLLDRLAEAMFIDMFGNTVNNSLGWEDSRTLGEVSETVSGITKGRKADGPFELTPYLAVVNVQDMRLDLSTVKEIDATPAEIIKYRLKRNDLLLTEGGDPDKLGRGTLWKEELPLCIHQNHIFRVRLHEGVAIDPVFLNWLISSERGRRYFLRSAKQTTGIASINATQLKKFPLLVPPFGLQRTFAERLAKIEGQKATQQFQLVAFDELFASLQAKAFCGEL